MEHAIVLKNIKFKYFGSEYNQFENLNLEIPLNKHAIITGPNGSGEITLLGIIAGVFVPEQGEIISSSTKYGYVGTTPMILDSTLRENLKYGNKENIDDSKLIQLVEDFKLFKESNVDLNLMVNNKSLSSGQMQKISLLEH